MLLASVTGQALQSESDGIDALEGESRGLAVMQLLGTGVLYRRLLPGLVDVHVGASLGFSS